MAVINPATRKGLEGMITGFVDRQWAKHHYRRWYREHHEASESGNKSSAEYGEEEVAENSPSLDREEPVVNEVADRFSQRIRNHATANEDLAC